MLPENSVDVSYKCYGAPSIRDESFFEQDVSVLLPGRYGDVFSSPRQGRHRSILVSAAPQSTEIWTHLCASWMKES